MRCRVQCFFYRMDFQIIFSAYSYPLFNAVFIHILNHNMCVCVCQVMQLTHHRKKETVAAVHVMLLQYMCSLDEGDIQRGEWADTLQ